MKLQSFKCHKIVQAAALLSLSRRGDNLFIILETEPEVQHPLDPKVISRYLPTKGDYLVQYEDGYLSFSPKDVFEAGYSAIKETMNFGEALHELKAGRKVARKGWNGKGMWLIMVPGSDNIKPVAGTPYSNAGITSEIQILPHIDMYTVDSTGRRAMLPGWLASQTDMLADDWEDVG